MDETLTRARLQIVASPLLGPELRAHLEPARSFEVLEPDLSGGWRLMDEIRASNPDLLLVDADLADLDLVAALGELAQAEPPPRVVAVARDYAPHLLAAEEHPVTRGTLLRKLALSPLLRPVLLGITYGCRYLLPPPRRLEPIPLSEYETLLLSLMAVGLDNGDLVEQLGRSIDSIYSAQHQIRRKLSVTSNHQSIVIAIKLGLVGALTGCDRDEELGEPVYVQ